MAWAASRRAVAGRLVGSARQLLRDLIDFCYPGRCVLCGSSAEAGQTLCPQCFQPLWALEASAGCPRCGMPISQDGAPCPFCEGKGVPHYASIVRLGTFEDPLKQLVHQMKYRRQSWFVADFLADRLLEQPRVTNLLADSDVLVPVPLHRSRQFERGYNQADLIARRLARRVEKPIVRPLKRVRNTPTQTQLTRAERFANLKDAFRLTSPEFVRGKRALVIDDVTTTGATLQTVARTLKPARPAELNALLIAIADPKGRGFRAV